MVSDGTVRIAMWSGPRNISTAMMRSFASRADCAVVDEPFYAAYLAATGLDHPMRDAVLTAQSTDWRKVAANLVGPMPEGRRLFYQKHMTHHMLPGFGRDWLAQCRGAFLIRPPAEVLASYAARRDDVTIDDIGIVQQARLFDEAADRLGVAPPVIEARDILENPRRALAVLCAALAIPFDEAMLSWPAGPHPADGVWAPVWYQAVQRSTTFARPVPPIAPEALDTALRPIAEAAQPYYERLAAHRLAVD